MVASLVNHGVLNETLVYENCGEMYLIVREVQALSGERSRGDGDSPEFHEEH